MQLSKILVPLMSVAVLATAGSACAAVTFSVDAAFDDGGTLLGTFTTDDSLQSLVATSLTVAGGSLGLDSVVFNEPSYITDGVVNLPNGFRLVAYSSVNKSLSLSFTAPLTQAGAALDGVSNNSQSGVGTRYIVRGAVTGPADGGVSAVPEPASWALLIAGFGGAGAIFRRRKAVQA
jgi:hypothetical protein